MKKEMKEGTKEEKKKGKIPELYLDIQRRRTADECLQRQSCVC